MENCISSFVETIKFHIAENNMTPTSFARAIGVSDTSVARWIGGGIMPSLENVIKVANYMNCSLDYLLNLTDQMEYFSPTAQQQTFAERLALLFNESKTRKVDAARVCGIDSSAVARWLYHKHLPKPHIVYNLAEYFGCTIDYLVGRSFKR